MADIQGLLDTFFLSKQNPQIINLLGLTEDEKASLNTQQNISTGVGALKGVLENYNQGVVPSIVGGYLSGAAGRQSPVTNLITQKKTARELQKLGYETNKLEREDVGNKSALAAALVRGAPQEEINNLLINPTEVVKAQLGASPVYNKDLQLFGRSINKPDINVWTDKDFQNFQTFSSLPTSSDAAKEDVNRARLEFETGKTINAPLTKEQFLKNISSGIIPQSQPQGTPTGTPQTKPSYGYKQPEKEIKQGIPLIESSAISPKSREQLVLEQPKATQATEYALNSTRRIKNSINRILDNPNFKEAFGADGVLRSYIPNTEAASAVSELDTLKNQLFLDGITDMRNASQTGAAVGNVTEKEGSRFENLKASLQQKKKFSDIVAELERLDKEMDTSEKRLSNAYGRTYRPIEFIIDPLYTRGSYKSMTSKAIPDSTTTSGQSWGIRKIK